MDISFNPVPVEKGLVQLAIVPMPDSPDLDEGAVNRLKVSVRYLKDGMGRGQGRGYYLVVTGAAYDGRFETHMLMQDPSEYVLIEGSKRFSAKVFDKVVSEAPERMAEQISDLVERGRSYYEAKGRPKQPEPGSWSPPSRV